MSDDRDLLADYDFSKPSPFPETKAPKLPAKSPPTPKVESRAVDTARVAASPWRTLLITKRVKNRETGEWVEVVAPTLPNVVAILRYHERWAPVLAWDAFGERIVFRQPPPWHAAAAQESVEAGLLRETDTGRMIDWFAREEHLEVAAQVVERAVPVVAEAHAFHPVREYLQRLRWDGVERLPTWLSTYCGCEQSEYSAAIGTRWLISAVARPMQPGCQVDCMLVLESRKQGTGKSSAFRALVPDPSLYSETGITIGDKDSYQCLHGIWIYLLDELDSFKRAGITKVKNFISSPKDHYRPSYGRIARDFYRQTVLAGSTNEEHYLVDRTGNRRIWPARVVREIDVDAIVRDRDQLWAEAFARYSCGERWHVDTPELRRLCEAQQADRIQGDPWEAIVAEWLRKPYQPGVDQFGKPTRDPFDDADGVTTTDLLLYALEKRRGDITRADEMRVAEILRDLGYEQGRQQRVGGERVRRYRKVVTVVTEGRDDRPYEKTASDSTSSQPSQPSQPSAHMHARARPRAYVQDANRGRDGSDGDGGGPGAFDDLIGGGS